MREVEHDPRNNKCEEPNIQGLSLSDLRYADDTALVATTPKGLENIIMAVKEHSEQRGLHLNVKKTKIMDTDKCKEDAIIKINGEEIERVNSFEYLGARIDGSGKSTPEIRRRLAMATSKLIKMAKLWTGQSVDTKVRILKSTVFPTATYGCETWTINKSDGEKITAFEMKCYRKIMRISWVEKVTNKEVLARIGIDTPTLLQTVKKLKLKYFGHIKRHETLQKHILEAMIEGKRGKGRPTRRWEKDIEDWLQMTTPEAGRIAGDRVLYRSVVREATSQEVTR